MTLGENGPGAISHKISEAREPEKSMFSRLPAAADSPQQGEPGLVDGFRYTGHGRKRRGKTRPGHKNTKDRDASDDGDPSKRMNHRRELVEEKRKLLRETSWSEKWLDCANSVLGAKPIDYERSGVWPAEPPIRILCLGLGSVKDNRVAQIQLALLLEMRALIQRRTGSALCHVQAFDPIWDDDTKALLRSFEIDVSLPDKMGAYALDDATLVYMPHCDRKLYEALLRENWSRQGLARLTLCSNRLAHYDELDSGLRRNSPCIHAILPFLRTLPVPNLAPPNHDALNEICFQASCWPNMSLPSAGRPAADDEA